MLTPRLTRLERRLRLVSGLVLALYALLHFSNHALGIVSLDAMEQMRRPLSAAWRSAPGTVLLYGSLGAHFVLALLVLWRRSTLRMPAWEMAQLALGLLIPPLILGHLLFTRGAREILDYTIDYPNVLALIWSSDPTAFKQALLLVCVWLHAVLGVHYWARLKAWYRRAVPALYAAAVLVPVLGLIGFWRGGVLVDEAGGPGLLIGAQPAADPEVFQRMYWLATGGAWWIMGALLGLVLLGRAIRHRLRLRHGTFRVHHRAGAVVRAPVGRTILEALRAARVPHASVCGGRARCTTCRVRVGAGLEALDAPAELEARALARIAAEPNVRLACQTRPRADVAITPLLLPDAGAAHALRAGGVQGHETQVAVMFIDLRGSTALGETRLPYDVVFILNQFFAEMSEALRLTGGHYAQFNGDGLMALYGLRSDLGSACRQAIRGAVEMHRRLEELNLALAAELPAPLRMGIGIHCGEAIVGTMGPPETPIVSAIGDNINVAARLEAQTKVFDCTLVVSEATARQAGIELGGFPVHSTPVRGRDQAITVYAVDDPARISLP